MAGNTPGEGKLLKQLFHPLQVLAHVWVGLAVGPFQPSRRHRAWTAMAGAHDVDHVEIAFDDAAV